MNRFVNVCVLCDPLRCDVKDCWVRCRVEEYKRKGEEVKA